MSQGYTKLFGSIVHSTIWRESASTKVVWITMLALADADGEVMASVPGLQDLSRVTRKEAEVALKAFLDPDPDSRSEEFEGRRIEKIAGGWRLLNHAKYKNLQTKTQKRQKAAERQARYRETQRGQSVTVTECHKSNPTQTQTQTNTLPPPVAQALLTGGKSYPPQDFEPSDYMARALTKMGAENVPLLVEKYKTTAFKAHCEPQAARFKRFCIEEIQRAQARPGAKPQRKGTRALPGER